MRPRGGGSAFTAGEAAIKADPNSESGKAAADKLKAMKPAIDALKKADTEKAAKADQERREAERERKRVADEQRKAELDALKAKNSASRLSDNDSRCASEGKPPVAREFTGGTYDENETVALSMGCKHGFYVPQTASLRDMLFNRYCCPK